MAKATIDNLKSKLQSKTKTSKLVGKQKNLDVNKNGKLDAEDFKMLRGEKMAEGGETGQKLYYTMDNVGKAKYTVSKYDGESTHKDGSPFYDIRTFKNKVEYQKYLNQLHKEGYKERGINLKNLAS